MGSLGSFFALRFLSNRPFNTVIAIAGSDWCHTAARWFAKHVVMSLRAIEASSVGAPWLFFWLQQVGLLTAMGRAQLGLGHFQLVDDRLEQVTTNMSHGALMGSRRH